MTEFHAERLPGTRLLNCVYNIFRERIDLLGETKQLAKQEYESLDDYLRGYRIYIAKTYSVVCLTTLRDSESLLLPRGRNGVNYI